MRFGVLGDIHGDFASARRVMTQHSDIPFWLCVGDVATAEGEYEPLPSPLYWIKGNNENFDRIASGDLPAGLHFVPNATVIELGPAGAGGGTGLRVAGLGGTFAPTWYDTAPGNLPHPKKGSARATELADKRRHFVRAEADACSAMQGIDVFLSHEAARPFKVGRIEAGRPVINEVLASMKPRLHFFGHHHRFSEQVREGVRSIGLDLVSRSFVLVEARTWAVEKHDAAS